MAFSDPQAVTISGNAHSLPRVSSGENSGSFQENDGSVKMTVQHQYGKRTRRTIRLEHSKIAPDPLISSANIKFSMTAYVVIDTPVTGYTVAEAKAVADALFTFLTASSGAATTKLLGGEN
jgi:hypothetical protein